MRTIKLMADYHCFPLWEASSGEVGNIDPYTLPISDTLQSKLLIWALKYDATLNMDDPLNSGFPSSQAADSFKSEGIELVEQLRTELEDQYVVTYKI